RKSDSCSRSDWCGAKHAGSADGHPCRRGSRPNHRIRHCHFGCLIAQVTDWPCHRYHAHGIDPRDSGLRFLARRYNTGYGRRKGQSHWRNGLSAPQHGRSCFANLSPQAIRGGEMRTVVITGANVGIGFATAKYLAARPDWQILLACRNEAKAKQALDGIKQAYPHSHVGFAPLDLFSLDSVRRLPTVLAAMQIPPIGGLILNAGGINTKAKVLEFTDDGFEKTFQLNYLAHFLLANLLVQSMTAPARIIFVSSDLHDPAATKMGKIAPPRYGLVDDLAR